MLEMLTTGMERILAGHYQIVKPLGGGGFGQTFLARDSHLPGNPLCVVKQLQPRVSDATTLQTAKRLFNQEAEVLHQLGVHDQIPRLLAHFEQDQEFYLVQELIEGQPLDREITPGRRLTEDSVVKLLQDILQVLAFVHQRHVIHRDIKPANLIRRRSDNRIVLIDFGAVKEVGTQAAQVHGQTNLTVAIGSPGYMPSEQQSFKPQFSSDIYAVGVLCIQALTGQSPREFPRDAQTDEYACNLFPELARISPGLQAILDRMVRYDYRQRYANAAIALQALQQFLGHNSLAAKSKKDLALANPLLEATQLPPTQLPPSTVKDLPPAQRQRLEQLLGEIIGPMAAMLLRRALEKGPTELELIEQLATHLPEAARSRFRGQAIRLLNYPLGGQTTQSQDQTQPAPISSQPRTEEATTTPTGASKRVDSAFAKQCETELTKLIGPIAPLLVRRTLAQSPALSQSQLVELLVQQHLPNAEQAASLRRNLLTIS